MVEFCRALRSARVVVTPSESVDAVSVLPLIDISKRAEFHDSLRATLVKRSEDYHVFEQVYQSFWNEGEPQDSRSRMAGLSPQLIDTLGEAKRDEKSTRDRRNQSPREVSPVELSPSDGLPARETLAGVYSPIERLGTRKFTNLSLAEVPQIRRGFRLLARRLATRPGRRMVRSRKGNFDFAATMRGSLHTGGELLWLKKMDRAISRTRLVVLCDVSGSMDAHTTKLLKLLYLAQNTIPGTKVFAFSTRLTKLEQYLRGRSLWKAAEEASRNVEIWSSGTRIGSALGRLFDEHASVLRPDTVLMIISDGWEVGDLDTLGENLARIRARVRNIIWLNPLADDPDYQPVTLGMKTALPYLDLLCGLNILTHRHEFERILGKTIRARTATKTVRRSVPRRVP